MCAPTSQTEQPPSSSTPEATAALGEDSVGGTGDVGCRASTGLKRCPTFHHLLASPRCAFTTLATLGSLRSPIGSSFEVRTVRRHDSRYASFSSCGCDCDAFSSVAGRLEGMEEYDDDDDDDRNSEGADASVVGWHNDSNVAEEVY